LLLSARVSVHSTTPAASRWVRVMLSPTKPNTPTLLKRPGTVTVALMPPDTTVAVEISASHMAQRLDGSARIQ
jgi:hypothetical protein